LSIEYSANGNTKQLNQYYALRERCYRRELGIADFDGSEEEQDRQGQILLSLRDGECIGGVRIGGYVTWPSQVEPLGLQVERCCMWERFVIEPRVRTVQLAQSFCSHLVNFSIELGFRHAMILSSLRNARFYRRHHSALGVDFRIHRPVPHCAKGSFAGLEHYLSVAYLDAGQPLQIAV